MNKTTKLIIIALFVCVLIFYLQEFFISKINSKDTKINSDVIFQYNSLYMDCTAISETEIYCLIKDIQEL